MSIFNSSIYRKTSGSRCLTLLRNVVLPLAVLLFSATSQGATTVTYYHNDALGSPVAATDANGTVIWREQYRPFGETLRNDPAADNNSRSFSGHVKDKETGLLYMGARFYDPQLGRFMAIDPQGFKASNPQTFNRYAYANNNPYKYVDPDGESPVDIIFFAVDLYSFGAAVASGQGIGEAGINLGISAIGLASPIPGLGLAIKAGRGAKAASRVAKSAGRGIGILRDAAKGKGNFGLGSGSRAEADKLGKAWVGDGYKVASDGKTLVGKDGLRQYRPPSYKGRLGKTQANFEQKFPGQKTKRWQSNGHLDITD